MNNNNTLYVVLDVHKESITVAYAITVAGSQRVIAHSMYSIRLYPRTVTNT